MTQWLWSWWQRWRDARERRVHPELRARVREHLLAIAAAKRRGRHYDARISQLEFQKALILRDDDDHESSA